MEHVILAAVVWLLAALTLTTGVGAGVVYSPMFVIFYGLDLQSAVATSIVIQLAGVGSTAVGHVFSRNVDRTLSGRLGRFGLGGALAAWAIKDRIPATAVEVVFVVSMLAIGVWLFVGTRPLRALAVAKDDSGRHRVGANKAAYEFCKPNQGYGFSALAGAATSILGVSGAEIQVTALTARCNVPTPIAIGTGTVAATVALLGASLLAVAGRAIDWPIALVAIPAAALGSWAARSVAGHLPAQTLSLLLPVLVIASALGVAAREAVL